MFIVILSIYLMLDMALIVITAMMKWFREWTFRSTIREVVLVSIVGFKLVLCMCLFEKQEIPAAFMEWFRAPWYLHFIFPTLVLLHTAGFAGRELVLHQLNITKSSIQTAINELESGLMFVYESGYIALMNRRMEKLILLMTGKYPRDGSEFWTYLISHKDDDICKRVDFSEGPSFLFKSGEIWSFTRNIIRDSDTTYMEIVAKDVTDLYGRRIEIEEENRKLERLERELGVVLRNISETSNEEELLNYKIRIHDQLGNAILRSRKTIRDGHFAKSNIDEVLAVWENTVKAFKTNIAEHRVDESSAFETIISQANDFGIKIIIEGDIPKDNPLITRTIKEAMYNSIRHAYANTIYVESARTDDGIKICIHDDGIFTGNKLSEGGGLSSIRKEIEQNGGTMEVLVNRGVTLNLFFRSKE